MKIAVLGSSGRAGKRIVDELERRGHDVVKVNADIHDPDVVAEEIRGCDAVVSAVGPRQGTDPNIVVAAARTLIEALPRAGVDRLVAVGGAASLEVEPGVLVIDTPDFHEPWKPIARAHIDALAVYRGEADGLAWTFFSPAALFAPGERTGAFRLGRDQLISDAEGNSSISMEDYAIALVDELERPAHVRARFTIGY